MHRIRLVLFLLVLVLVKQGVAISLYVGTVEGKITDTEGAGLKGAMIVLTPVSDRVAQTQPVGCAEQSKQKGSQKASTGPKGAYKFVAVRPGRYNLCFESDGYEIVTKQAEIKQAVTNTFNIVLKKK